MKTNSFPLNQFLSTATPPELGPGPRAGVRSLAALNRELEAALAQAGLAGNRSALVRATILLWHDHLDAAHTIAQDVETTDGSYVHAIMHRREPDYSNAKYWFHRVGRHACFAELAARVTAMLKTADDGKLLETFVPRGQWDSFAFVDACEAAAGRPESDARVGLLRKIQQVEFEVLLEYLSGETAV
jgi:hypothetical protein